MDGFDKYRQLLFFLTWFFLLSLFALIVLRGETGTVTFKVALTVFFLTLVGIVRTAIKLRRKIREEMAGLPPHEEV
ncbi:hypothetical protein [Thermococcus gorgonarius]|uniref:Uncharacterized protein n=1 Tax=Thermococcus gorgonarius TaxID=71997 RepID=A0A2Z2M675_THEGO|nr:hypothetical protein [Thermococcus gorgonarius]ASJ00649.1 hypothetical protein A3K92_03750 [Thermococcus gorgonarius]